MSEAQKLIAELPDDERLRHDVIEGETQALECLDAYAEQAIADASLVKQARERAQRLEARAARNRAVVSAILQGLQLKRAERPLFTASLAQRTEVVEVATNEALPSAFVRYSPDKVLIGKTLRAGDPVPGYELQDKTDVTLTLRTA
jgi:phosphoglycolate phosphatase-like HAD superfamily hydrolase